MKGVVLAGGLGTRFLPLTKVTNKHLLDVYDEPMILFPIRTLIRAGINDIVPVTGCYMYDGRVFDFIRTLRPSGRGELEVTDLNNIYIGERTMTYEVLAGWWTDAGTPASKLKASILVALEKGVTFHR